jgi:hypothetical protein
VTLVVPTGALWFKLNDPEQHGVAASFTWVTGERQVRVGVEADRAWPRSRHDAYARANWATPGVREFLDRFHSDWDFYTWVYSLTSEAFQDQDDDTGRILWHFVKPSGRDKVLYAFIGPDTRALATAGPQGSDPVTLGTMMIFDVGGERRGVIGFQYDVVVPQEQLRRDLQQLATMVVIEPRKQSPATQPDEGKAGPGRQLECVVVPPLLDADAIVQTERAEGVSLRVPRWDDFRVASLALSSKPWRHPETGVVVETVKAVIGLEHPKDGLELRVYLDIDGHTPSPRDPASGARQGRSRESLAFLERFASDWEFELWVNGLSRAEWMRLIGTEDGAFNERPWLGLGERYTHETQPIYVVVGDAARLTMQARRVEKPDPETRILMRVFDSRGVLRGTGYAVTDQPMSEAHVGALARTLGWMLSIDPAGPTTRPATAAETPTMR